MDAKKAIITALQSEGCSVLRLGESPSLGTMAVVAKEGRDILAMLLSDGEARTNSQQKFCDHWRGVPPVNLYTIADAKALAGYIEGGEFDRSKVQAAMSGTVVLKPGRRRDY